MDRRCKVIVVMDGDELADLPPVAEKKMVFISESLFLDQGPTRALCLPGHEPRRPCFEYQGVNLSLYGSNDDDLSID